MAKANLAKSRILAVALGAEREFSFRNAYDAVWHLPERAFYVEGFAADDRGVIEHAWVEFEGDILEPTSAWRNKEGVEYFAGRKYSRTQAVALVEMYGSVPLAWADASFGPKDPAYNLAREEAYAYTVMDRPKNGSPVKQQRLRPRPSES